MRIQVWGVRGSLPSPLTPIEVERKVESVLQLFLERGHHSASDVKPFLASLSPGLLGGYGGNTPCIEVNSPETQIIIDGGSGIRGLGAELMKGPCGHGQGRLHILMTHFHWDHLIGLPFFMPLYVPGNEVHFYAVQEELPKVFSTLFKRPYFPVEIAQLQSSIQFHQLAPREPCRLGDLAVTPYRLDHPDPCWGFRIEGDGKVFSHCVDSESTRFTREELGPDLPLYQNVDLLIFDAQYGLLESIKKENWGHGSAMVGIDLALRERIKRILFMHHDPATRDRTVLDVELETKKYYENQRKQFQRNKEVFDDVEWGFAQEGMVVEI
jgi:phosphoribosyl 1,2-cyclic phosphodiesterase